MAFMVGTEMHLINRENNSYIMRAANLLHISNHCYSKYGIRSSRTTSTTATPEAIANSITALITSIGSLAVTVGTVIGLVFTFLKARDAHGIATRAENIGIKVGQYATAFGAKSIENKENIKNITEAALALTPDDTQKAIATKKAIIDALQKQIDADNAQLAKLLGGIPTPEAIADNRDDIMRPKPEELDLVRAIKIAEEK